MIPIESREGITLYGKVIDNKTKRLGRFEVYSNDFGNPGTEYMRYPEAHGRFNSLVHAVEQVENNGKNKARQHRQHGKTNSKLSKVRDANI